MMNSTYSTMLGTGIAGTSAFVGLIFCCIYIFIILVGIAMFVIWIWMFIDLLQRKEHEFGDSFGKGSDAKVIWLILMFVTGGIASLIYYFMIYKKYPRSK